MRVLVCGGRDFNEYESLEYFLDAFRAENDVSVVIHGAARGADSMAGEWAKSRGIPVIVFPADWNRHGRAAGPIRNKKMLDEGKPNLVISFPGGRGTANMMEQARAAGVPVMSF